MIEKLISRKLFEKRFVQMVDEAGVFHKGRVGQTVFSMVTPPPNITVKLHLGHGPDNAIQDTLIRFKRMQGYNTLWLRTDHASIATEVKIVEQLKKEGVDKRDLGRESFLERAWA